MKTNGHEVCHDEHCSAAGGEFNHPRCERCLTRAERRWMKRMRRRGRPDYDCCSIDPRTGARKYDLGKHNHAAQPGALDHATGTNAWASDPSMTKTVRRRIFGDE